MRMAMLLILLWIQAPIEAATEVFRWIDENGVVHFGDRPPTLDRGDRIRVREPNLVDPVEPTVDADRPARASRQRDGLRERRQQWAEARIQCDKARDQQRALRARRRSGYALAEARALDREAEEIAAAIRQSCR